MSIITKINEVIDLRIAATTLEGVLLDLAKHGRARIGQYGRDGTWHCSVEMNVPSVGVTFEVKSDYDCKTPMSSAVQCRERMMTALGANK